MPQQYGGGKCQTLTVRAGATLSTDNIDLGMSYQKIWLEIPTMTSNTTMNVFGAHSSTPGGAGDFRQLWRSDDLITTFAAYQVNSGITNAYVEIPGGFQFYKIRFVSSQVSNVTLNFHASPG